MDFDPELKHLHEVQVREQLQKQQRGFLEHLSKPSNTRSRKAPIDRVHRVKRSMSLKVIMNKNSRVSMQCMPGVDGAYYYIPLDSYNPEHLSIITELSPLLVNPRPRQFKTGALYTYIVASIIYKDPNTHEDIEAEPMKLYTSKAINMFEFGTKHHQIFYRMASTSELHDVARRIGVDVSKLQYALHASGEIHCINPNTLEFNFYSGTYKMQRVIPKKRAPYEIALITKLMQGIDASYDISFESKPFIVPEVLSITPDQIAHLKRMGIPSFKFTQVADCKKMRIEVLYYKNTQGVEMTYEQMDSLYDSIITPPPEPVYIPPNFDLPKMPLDQLIKLVQDLKLSYEPNATQEDLIRIIKNYKKEKLSAEMAQAQAAQASGHGGRRTSKTTKSKSKSKSKKLRRH